jgi:hypothetical protein
VCSATGAHGPIIEQGEGARGDWRTAHYGRFFKVWKEHAEMKRRDPGFEPARPGPRYPGRTAGPTFEMHYQMGNVLPWREPAWRIIHERLVVLGDRCVGLADQAAVPDQVRAAADRTRRIAAQFGAHVPPV